MVQYRGRDAISPTNYWQLFLPVTTPEAKQFLESRGVEIPKMKSKTQFQNLVSRKQRGLMRYEACLPTELRRFCANRQLAIPSPTHGQSKRTTIEVLEQADESATFDKFNDLPPELRSNIYDLYFAALETPCLPTQPPITLVSKQARREALPLFNDICTFEIRMWLQQVGDIVHGFNPCLIGRDVNHFFSLTSDAAVEDIRNLRILGAVNVVDISDKLVVSAFVGFALTVSNGKDRVESYPVHEIVGDGMMNPTSSETLKRYSPIVQPVLEDRLKEFVRDKKPGGKSLKLAKGDAPMLEALFNPVVLQQDSG